MKAFLKCSYFYMLLLLHLGMSAQDSLSVINLKSLSYHFTLVDGKIQGNGLEFLKKELTKAQFTLLGDYPDSKSCSELTSALISLLHAAKYSTLALGIGIPSSHLLDSLSRKPETIASEFKKLNTQYSFLENEKLVTPMPDMKFVEDVEFVQKVGEKNWSLIGFGYESWNALALLANTMYNNLPEEKREEHKAAYTGCSEFLRQQYHNRNGDLHAFTDAINEAKVVRKFLKIAAAHSKNDIYISAFETSLKRAKMYANREFFEKNQLRINDEKRFLKQELKRIGFDIRKDKLFVKWDRNFLSRGFQPYAFYGMGNMLSEIADYNGLSSLHMAVIPRYIEKNREVKDVLNLEKDNSPALSSLLKMGQKNQWTIIDLRPMVPGHFYTPRKYLLNDVEEDFIKRFDILIIPPIEKEAKLLIDSQKK